MTYEDNKKKRSTLPVVGSVRTLASDLCFLGDIQLPPFMRMGSEVLWFYRQSNNSKTMETTKEEMMMLLRELQDLKMWLLNRDSKLSLIFTLCGNRKILASVVGITYHSVEMSERKPFNENAAKLDDFIDYVKRTEYECKKSETNRTTTGKARV